MRAVDENAQPVAHLIGASIPRSGHHFLASILRAYYKEEIHYCGYYKVKHCCHEIPCVRRASYKVMYQKHHDAQFDLPANLPGIRYVVQYREPVSEALSDLELHLKRRSTDGGTLCTSTRERFLRWLAKKAQYYTLFHDKWVAPRSRNCFFINYSDLATNPGHTVGQLLSCFDSTFSEVRLSDAISSVAGQRGGSSATYKPRVIEDSPHFDRHLFSVFESLIIARCPSYGFLKILDDVDYQAHPLFDTYLSRPYRRANVNFSDILTVSPASSTLGHRPITTDFRSSEG